MIVYIAATGTEVTHFFRDNSVRMQIPITLSAVLVLLIVQAAILEGSLTSLFYRSFPRVLMFFSTLL